MYTRSISVEEETPSLFLQKRIHEAIIDVGGYWPPLSAVARLLEELGEFSEAILLSNKQMISEELADLWIISTCLANQYSAKLYIDETVIVDDNLEHIFIKAGEIARIANYYEGPKKLKPGEKIKSIEYMVSNLQSSLFSFAKYKDIDLINVVTDKVEKIATRDKDRFETSYDPSSSNSVKDFFNIIKNTGYPFTCLDAFVIAAPKYFGDSIENLSEFTRRTLTIVSNMDPAKKYCMNQNVSNPDWHCEINSKIFFILTFAACYIKENPRHSYGEDNTFIVFQAEHSFKK